MVVVKAFKGLRPKPEYVEKVASPPYDVISVDEAKKIVENNKYSFLQVIKSEMFEGDPYENAKKNLQKLINEGILIRDEEPKLYIYKQIWGDHVQVGLVACFSCDDYMNGIIKKHELTRAEKEEDRTKHILTTNANTGPVFLTYRAEQKIKDLIEDCMENPVYDFESNGVRHIFYVISDKGKIEEIQNAFKEVGYAYIADGHHRAAAAARVCQMKRKEGVEGEYCSFLGVIFPHDQLKILDYNRVVKGLNSLEKEEFLEKIREKFILEEKNSRFKPEKPHEFGMYLDGKWYRLEAKEIPSDPIESLDVQILQKNLLDPVLGIKDPRRDERIKFVGGIKGLEELERLVNEGGYTVAFALYPTSMEQIMEVADSGKTMPPKSTWFEPKLKSGLIVHLLS